MLKNGDLIKCECICRCFFDLYVHQFTLSVTCSVSLVVITQPIGIAFFAPIYRIFAGCQV